jgi:hypothetical protein
MLELIGAQQIVVRGIAACAQAHKGEHECQSFLHGTIPPKVFSELRPAGGHSEVDHRPSRTSPPFTLRTFKKTKTIAAILARDGR